MKTEALIGWIAAGIGGLYLLLRSPAARAGELTYPPAIYPVLTSGQRYTDPMEDLTVPKGIRNHNPMNLRYYPSIQWDGQIGQDADGYARFDTVYMGIRAGVKNLVNGYFKKGLTSPINIIEKYAPAHENPTDNYIKFVAAELGVDPVAPIPFDRANMIKLTKAIIFFENGSQPYSDSTIERGVDMGMA